MLNRGERPIDTLDNLRAACKVIDDKKGEDILILDVRKLSSVTDYYVIATGANARHLKALADEAQRALKDSGVRPYRQSGTPESGWLVVDFLDFVVHLFLARSREEYALETLWKDAPRIAFPAA